MRDLEWHVDLTSREFGIIFFGTMFLTSVSYTLWRTITFYDHHNEHVLLLIIESIVEEALQLLRGEPPSKPTRFKKYGPLDDP